MADTAASVQTKLEEAKDALHRLMLGDKEVEVSFGEARRTAWNKVDLNALRAYIAELEAQLATLLGQPKRGPIYPMCFPR